MLPAFNPSTQERQVDLRSSEFQDRLQNYTEKPCLSKEKRGKRKERNTLSHRGQPKVSR